MALRLLRYTAPPAVEAAHDLGWLPREAEAHGITTMDDAITEALKQTPGAAAFDPSTATGAALVRFLYLHLIVARGEQVQRYWEPYYYYRLGEEQAIDWNDEAVWRDCRCRLVAWLDSHPHTWELWVKSGLTLDDMFVTTGEEATHVG
jgi:hypothetical protein